MKTNDKATWRYVKRITNIKTVLHQLQSGNTVSPWIHFEKQTLGDSPGTELDFNRIVKSVNEYDALNAVAKSAKDMQDFISAIVDATQNGGKIDENSIMRLGERLKTTAVRCNSKAITKLTHPAGGGAGAQET